VPNCVKRGILNRNSESRIRNPEGKRDFDLAPNCGKRGILNRNPESRIQNPEFRRKAGLLLGAKLRKERHSEPEFRIQNPESGIQNEGGTSTRCQIAEREAF
jgi:hypothetical protein